MAPQNNLATRRTVIIRDDDVSAFTPPSMLQMLYSNIWRRGDPVCLSVIPAHYDSVYVPYRSAIATPDENIPSASFGNGVTHPLGENPELVAFLKMLEADSLAELCLHGFEHRYLEFVNHDDSACIRLVQNAVTIFGDTFPTALRRTFIPPYDMLSEAALRALEAFHLNVCTSSESFANAGLSEGVLANIQNCKGRWNDITMFVGDDYLFDPLSDCTTIRRDIQMLMDEPPDVLIVVNHYWSFFHSFSQPDKQRLQLWYSFVDFLYSNDYHITTFQREAQP